MPFENIVKKGGNAGDQHFLLSQQCFLPFPPKNSIFSLAVFGENPRYCGSLGVVVVIGSVVIGVLDLTELEAFADNKINVTQKLEFAFGHVENIEDKGGNAGYMHFLLFPQCFRQAFWSGLLKVGIV